MQGQGLTQRVEIQELPGEFEQGCHVEYKTAAERRNVCFSLALKGLGSQANSWSKSTWLFSWRSTLEWKGKFALKKSDIGDEVSGLQITLDLSKWERD